MVDGVFDTGADVVALFPGGDGVLGAGAFEGLVLLAGAQGRVSPR